MDIGLITAFLGGTLALLSPCGALLLPAFFASVAGSGPRLLLHGSIFTLGLLLVLVPLGIGVGAVGSLFLKHRMLIIAIASAILVIFGLLQIFGIGFDAAKFLPGVHTLQYRAATSVGLAKTFLLGAASGIAGFCAGPILGAVLTIAAAQGEMVGAGLLLAVYGAGMVVPLLIIASCWGRLGQRGRRVLRGRSFTVFGRPFHSTSVITGLIITTAGILFWVTNGLVNVPSLLPTSVSAWLQGNSSVLAHRWVDLAVVLAIVGVMLFIWWRSSSRGSTTPPPPIDSISKPKP